MGDEWRNEPATKKQKDKLRFFGCTFDDGITKGQASDAIDQCIQQFPEKEIEYQDRPATKAQMKKVLAYLKANQETIEDHAENGKFITYSEAKEIIEDWEDQQQEAELEAEYIIDVEGWAELYPGLTEKRVQSAAKALDVENPGWRDNPKHIDLMLAQVARQNPQLAERWMKREARHSSGRKQKEKSGLLGVILFLAFVIWVIWKIASK